MLLFSCLSAKWENNDAIDKAVTGSLGDKKVRTFVIVVFFVFQFFTFLAHILLGIYCISY